MQAIFANASTTLRQPRNLKKLVESIDALDWYSARTEGLGDLYEGLLERNANETKSGAGQYFTPRPLIESMVALVQPRAGEVVQDPAAGTGGFLVAADRWVKQHTDDLFALSEAEQAFQRRNAFHGVELVPDTHRLLLMNAMLHGIEGDHLLLGDTLSPEGKTLGAADVILTNPPFGTKKGGGRPTRDDFTYPTSNKQLAFLQHVYRGLVARRAGGGGAPRQRAVRGGRGGADPRGPDGQVRPAHDPAAADGDLLRAGGEDERAVLHARAGEQGHGQHRADVGLRPAGEHAELRQAHAADARALRVCSRRRTGRIR